MDFRTNIVINPSEPTISHQSKLMLLGSCFAENIGNMLRENLFDVGINPFGILYNPASVSMALNRINDGKLFSEDELVYQNGLYHSFQHHGAFSNADKDKCLSGINEALKTASESLLRADTLLLTFGTAHVFRYIPTNAVVANCHKFPASDFKRSRLTIDEITDDWTALIRKLREQNPRLNVLFTVSPIRHLKDGAHGNQLSKAVLLLAIERLQQQVERTYYFPSYELLLDDLRDYRFYGEDMLHPNATAVKYIWDAFCKACFDEPTMQIINEWSGIRQALNHRPLNGETEQHKQFLKQTLLRLDAFRKKYPYFASEIERGKFI
ncbi:MAG: GSCFA domain-containing protein [Prevotella sp.]|jgi:hypothetical protein|nr:GSCFA domain-containing protein [Prevotella sp.]